MGASVVPDQRGTGGYRALIDGPLEGLRQRGLEMAAILALVSTSATTLGRTHL
jgi:hypothetical protein